MRVVLDASASLASLMGQDARPAVVEVLSRSTIIIAPHIYVCEVTSGLWKYAIAGELSMSEAAERFKLGLSVIGRFESEATFAEEALREAAARRHSVYDMFYAVLSRRENASLVTVDARLRKLARAMGVAVLP